VGAGVVSAGGVVARGGRGEPAHCVVVWWVVGAGGLELEVS
jgi:hypothetical protein